MLYHISNIVPLYGTLVTLATFTKLILHKRVITFIHSNYDTEYSIFLNNLNLRTVWAKRLKIICIKIYKIKSGLNTKYSEFSYH